MHIFWQDNRYHESVFINLQNNFLSGYPLTLKYITIAFYFKMNIMNIFCFGLVQWYQYVKNLEGDGCQLIPFWSNWQLSVKVEFTSPFWFLSFEKDPLEVNKLNWKVNLYFHVIQILWPFCHWTGHCWYNLSQNGSLGRKCTWCVQSRLPCLAFTQGSHTGLGSEQLFCV